MDSGARTGFIDTGGCDAAIYGDVESAGVKATWQLVKVKVLPTRHRAAPISFSRILGHMSVECSDNYNRGLSPLVALRVLPSPFF